MNLKSLIPIGRERTQIARREPNPFIALQNEIDRLVDQFARGFSVFGASEAVPSMDLAETDKHIELVVELPGIEAKDVEINLADNILTIRGERKAEKEEKDKNYRMIECSYGAFARSVELPPGTDPNNVTATLANGVLKVTVLKPAAADVKKIPIKAAA